MRAIIAAIALIFFIGVALPTPADARAPRKVEKWGCTFKARPPRFEAYLDLPVTWGSQGDVVNCDRKLRVVVRMAIIEDVPGSANRVHSRQKHIRRQRAAPRGDIYTVLGGDCSRDDAAPTRYPVYTRMKVKRVGKPGVVRVTSRNKANPCIPWFSME